MKASMPSSEELERAYLVIPMLDPGLFELAAALIPSEEVFYLERHRAIWSAQKKVVAKGGPLDEKMLRVELEAAGKWDLVGGLVYLAGLYDELPDGGLANVEKYAERLRGLWAKRRLIALAESMRAALMGPSEAEEVLAETSASISEISMSQSGSEGPRLLCESLVDFDRWEPQEGLLGVPTGIYELDRMLLGLQAGQQIMVAARPGMGKTAFALGTAHCASKSGSKVLYFSLEMPESQCRDRLMSMESGIPLRAILTGRISKDQRKTLLAAMNKLGSLPLWIDDRPSLTTEQIAATASVHQMKHGLDLLVVDYLGLVRYVGKYSKDVDTLGEMARALRELARSLKVPIVLLHQLSREPEKRVDKRPMASDLRGSGKLEEHADNIVMIYRDEFYNDDSEDAGIAEILVVKQRQGEVGKILCAFVGELTAFRNLYRHTNGEKR